MHRTNIHRTTMHRTIFKLRRPRLAVFFMMGLLIANFASLFAQSVNISPPGQGDEKRPTSRDPRYRPPLTPDYIRRKLNPEQAFLFAPSGVLDTAGLARSRLEKARLLRRKKERYERRDYSDQADLPGDRRRFERGVLRQFGVDVFPRTEPAVAYRETGARRFGIVFGISLPITLMFAYGIVSLAKGETKGGSSFTGPQTAAFAGLGILSSLSIAWYDSSRKGSSEVRERRTKISFSYKF